MLESALFTFSQLWCKQHKQFMTCVAKLWNADLCDSFICQTDNLIIINVGSTTEQYSFKKKRGLDSEISQPFISDSWNQHLCAKQNFPGHRLCLAADINISRLQNAKHTQEERLQQLLQRMNIINKMW